MLSRVAWWQDEAPPDAEAEPLSGEAEADVAIVGGGYAGLWTALELKRRQPALRLAVLEAEHVGAGYSGNGVGPSRLGGQILASLVLGSDDEWSRLPPSGRTPPRLPPEPVCHLGGALVRRAILAVEAADEAGRRPPLLARGVAALPRVLGLRIGTR